MRFPSDYIVLYFGHTSGHILPYNMIVSIEP